MWWCLVTPTQPAVLLMLKTENLSLLYELFMLQAEIKTPRPEPLGATDGLTYNEAVFTPTHATETVALGCWIQRESFLFFRSSTNVGGVCGDALRWCVALRSFSVFWLTSLVREGDLLIYDAQRQPRKIKQTLRIRERYKPASTLTSRSCTSLSAHEFLAACRDR